MGCCLSAGDHPKTEHHHHPNGGAPPLEEETVKEVLLETPIIPKAVSVDEKVKEMPPRNEEWRVEVGSAPVMNSNRDPPRINNEEIISEVSEISEMYSISESFSNTTAQEKRDDDDDEDGEVNQRPPARKRRRPARGRGRGRGERVTPRRTAAPSPENKGQVAPLRPSRGRPMVGQPRNAAEVNGRLKDLGEGSGRRSTSPVRSEEKETSARRDVSEEDKSVSVSTREPPPEAAEEAESLENPVVSLECFIFL